MELIRCQPVAAMLAALFVFVTLSATGIIGSSQNLVFQIAGAGLCD